MALSRAEIDSLSPLVPQGDRSVVFLIEYVVQGKGCTTRTQRSYDDAECVNVTFFVNGRTETYRSNRIVDMLPDLQIFHGLDLQARKFLDHSKLDTVINEKVLSAH